MDTTFFLHALLSAACAVVYADVLVQPGMLLAPVQAWLRAGWRAGRCTELDDQWWWQPIWGCFKCCAGWFGLAAYLYHYHNTYHWWGHAYFVTLTILFSLFIQSAVAWTRR